MPSTDLESHQRSGGGAGGMQASLLAIQAKPAPGRCGGAHSVLLAVSCAALCMSTVSVVMTAVMLHKLAGVTERTTTFFDGLDTAQSVLQDAVTTTFDEGRIKQTLDSAATVAHKLADIDWELNSASDPDLCYEESDWGYCSERPQSVCATGGRVCNDPDDHDNCEEYGPATLPDGGRCRWTGDTGRRLAIADEPAFPKRSLQSSGSCSRHSDCSGDTYCDSGGHCYDCSYVRQRGNGCDAIDGDCSTCGGGGTGGCTKVDASGRLDSDSDGFDIPAQYCNTISRQDSADFDRDAKKVGDAIKKAADSMSSATLPGDFSVDVNLQLTNFLSSDWHAIGGRCKSMFGKISDADWSALMGEEDASAFKADVHLWEEMCAKIEGGF